MMWSMVSVGCPIFVWLSKKEVPISSTENLFLQKVSLICRKSSLVKIVLISLVAVTTLRFFSSQNIKGIFSRQFPVLNSSPFCLHWLHHTPIIFTSAKSSLLLWIILKTLFDLQKYTREQST